MRELSFYSLYDYYTPDYLQFATILSNKLAATIHVSYYSWFYTDDVLPDKHFVNFFKSNLFYLQVNFFTEEGEHKVFYSLHLSSGIPALDKLEIYFLPNGLIRIFELPEDITWYKFVDMLYVNSLNKSFVFATLRQVIVFNFLRIFSDLGCRDLYFFPRGKYEFEKYINNIFSKDCSEKFVLEYQKKKDKIKLYTNNSITEYLNTSIHEGLLEKRKNKISTNGVFKLMLNPKSHSKRAAKI